jgi:uncharacterized protein (DUF1330 family)
MLKGYWIVRVDIADPEKYKAYIAANGGPLSKYGARFIVRAGRYETVEGGSRTRNAVIEFPSYQSALDCWNSPEYQEIIKLRSDVSTMDLIVIEVTTGRNPEVRFRSNAVFAPGAGTEHRPAEVQVETTLDVPVRIAGQRHLELPERSSRGIFVGDRADPALRAGFSPLIGPEMPIAPTSQRRLCPSRVPGTRTGAQADGARDPAAARARPASVPARDERERDRPAAL